MRANVYIDGFNLYHGGVQRTPHKWLDLGKLSRFLLPGHTINRVRYFTALVRAPERQLIYLRALKTIPNLTIHFGQFQSNVVQMRLAAPAPGGPTRVGVIKTEEKGSDVNLATMLLCDAYERDFELAAIVSADSDLATPITVVQERLGLRVIVLHPHRRHSAELKRLAGEYRIVRERALRSCQFPPVLRDELGEIAKPSGW